MSNHKVSITVEGGRLVPEDFRRHRELAIAAQGMEVEGSEAILVEGRQAHAEDALLPPLEVDAVNGEVAF